MCVSLSLSADYGTGYAYDPKQPSITEGDCVTWVWTTPSFVSGIGYGIYQTATDTSKDTAAGGFASAGANSANGKAARRADCFQGFASAGANSANGKAARRTDCFQGFASAGASSANYKTARRADCFQGFASAGCQLGQR